jgi:hypothetical protein
MCTQVAQTWRLPFFRFSRTIPLASDLAFLLAFSLPYRLSKFFLQLQ